MKLYRNTFRIITLILLLFQLPVNADTLDVKQIEKSIDKYLTYFSETNPGAVITVLKKGESAFTKAYGMSNVKEQVPMDIDRLFNLGELSKSFTALAVLQLVEKGTLSLDDKLSELFPGFPDYGEKITVQNILDHKSGLKNYNTEDLVSNNEVYNNLLTQTETIFDPGSKRIYSNSDYAILVTIIEKVSKMSYQDFLRKNIFKKLSMNNTFFVSEIVNKKLAAGHFNENGEYIVKNEADQIYGEQGIYMNTEDFTKWDKALYSNSLLKCENLSKIFRIEKLTQGENISDYSNGWLLMAKNGVRYFWHGGTKVGYSNLVLHLPDNQTTVLILTNRDDGRDLMKLAINIAKLFDKNLKL